MAIDITGFTLDDFAFPVFTSGGSSPPPPVPPGTGSVAERLAYDVAEVVNALAVCGKVVVRTQPTVTGPGDFPSAGMPLGIVVVQRGAAELLWAKAGADQGVDEVTYSVGVAVALPAPTAPLGPTADMNEWVEQVRRAVRGRKTFATTPEFSESNLTSKVPFNPGALSNSFVWGWCGFAMRCQEIRGTG